MITGIEATLWLLERRSSYQRCVMTSIESKNVGGVKSGSATESMAGCPAHVVKDRLKVAGLRPTRQRLALGWMLFGKGHRHVTAEKLYEEATAMRVNLSLATVYNTLHQFTQAALLREIAVDGSKTWFDTNTSRHHHFLIEGENVLVDIPGHMVDIARLPPLPDGLEIVDVDVVVRVRRIG